MQTVSETLTLPFAKYVKYPFRDIRSFNDSRATLRQMAK